MNSKFNKKTSKAPNLSFTILKMIGVYGGAAGKSIEQNAVRAFDSFIYELWKQKYPRYRINYAVRRLREQGWIKLGPGKNGRRYELTPDGQAALEKYEIRRQTIAVPRRWDKKWRIVIFDIREKRKQCREAIRTSLVNFGFKLLQESVWIFPYPCGDVIELAKTAYGVRHDAIYLVCDRFNGDEWLAFDFNLGLAPYG